MRLRSPIVLLSWCQLTVSGCRAGWYRPAEPVPAAFKPRQRIQIWRDGRPLVLHGVRVGADSITGVPLLKRPDCDSCRVALARRDVDSLRVGGTDDNTVAGIGLGSLVVGLAVLIYVASHPLQ